MYTMCKYTYIYIYIYIYTYILYILNTHIYIHIYICCALTYVTHITISEEHGHRFDTLKSELWNYQKAVRKTIAHDDNSNAKFIAIQKRCVIVNTLGAIYWTGTTFMFVCICIYMYTYMSI
jgi:hypothetical protein